MSLLRQSYRPHGSSSVVHPASPSRRLAVACVCLLLCGCDTRTSGPAAVAHEAHAAMATSLSSPEIAQALNAVRAHTASWHNPTKAEAAGYTLPVGCTDERTEGRSASEARGMGYHTLNPQLIDGQAQLLQPELLVYALDPASGKLKLAGFDYFVPGAFYPGPTSANYPGQPPILAGLGTPLMWNEAHSGWIAHIWPWLHNPDGMFENFNRNVPLCNCQISPTTALCTP